MPYYVVVEHLENNSGNFGWESPLGNNVFHSRRTRHLGCSTAESGMAVKAKKPRTGSKDAKRSMEQEFSFGTSQPEKFRDYLIKSKKDFKL